MADLPPSGTPTAAAPPPATGSVVESCCPKCGSPQRMGRYGVNCVRCLLGTGLFAGEDLEASADTDEPAAGAPDEATVLLGTGWPENQGFNGPTDASARMLDHYELTLRPDRTPWELGRGAMGVTYRAFDVNLRCTVALKVIHRHLLHDPAVRERFVREARAAAGLRHPNVASVFHLGTRAGEYFFAMEFIEGETVDALIRRRGPLGAPLALEIAFQVASALGAAHRQGLVHRDIKPANLMIERDPGTAAPEVAPAPAAEDSAAWIVKVIDFGVAKTAAGAGGADLTGGLLIGTPAFASPEQILGATVDFRSDLYSLGATLWFTLTGRPPFSGDAVRVIQQHLEQRPPFEDLAAAKIPAPVVALLRTLLEKEPRNRPQTPADFLEALARCESALPHGVAAAGARRGSRTSLRRIVGLGPRRPLRAFAFWWPRVRRPRVWLSLAAVLGAAYGAGMLGRGHYGLRVGPATPNPPGAGPATAAAADQTIAVLPFQNDSGQADDEHFADGITDDVIARLSKLDGLKVIASSSAAVFRKSLLPPAQIAARLGVRHLLSGSVRRQGERFRVWAELIDAPSGRLIWSDTLDDQRIGDLFVTQSRLAERIAGSLRLQLSPAKRASLAHVPTRDPLAYDCYLRGRAFYGRYTAEDMGHAVELFKKALAIDGDFALAHAGLAEAYAQQIHQRWKRDPGLLDTASAIAQEGVRRDPTSAECQRAVAFLCWVRGDPHECLQASQRAVALNANYVPALALCGAAWRSLGRLDQALPYLRRAIELDPVSARPQVIVGDTLTLLGDDEAAEAAFRKALLLQPDEVNASIGLAYLSLLRGEESRARQHLSAVPTAPVQNPQGRSLAAQLELFTGRWERAETLYRALCEEAPNGGLDYYSAIRNVCALAYLRVRAGKAPDSEPLLNLASRLDEETMQTSPDLYKPPYDLAAVRAIQGRKDEAISLLQRAGAGGWSNYRSTRLDPRFESLRQDERFTALVRSWEEKIAGMRRNADTLTLP